MQICFFDKKKKGTLVIIQPSLQFYGLVLEKPSAEERHGSHSKKVFNKSVFQGASKKSQP